MNPILFINKDIKLVGGLEHFIFFNISGVSSSHLTFIFFRGVGQPPTSLTKSYRKSPCLIHNPSINNIDKLHISTLPFILKLQNDRFLIPGGPHRAVPGTSPSWLISA